MGKLRKEKINFLLESKEGQKIHLIVYLSSVVLIMIIYVFVLIFFSNKPTNILFTGILALSIGVYMVYNKDKIVKKILEFKQEIKRRKGKKENKDGLRKTLRRITPRNRNLKLNIKGRVPIKEKIQNLKEKIVGKEKKKDYIEYRD